MHLVDESPTVSEVRQEPFRVGDGLLANIAFVERSPRESLRFGDFLAEGALADLPRPHHRNHGVQAQVGAQLGQNDPWVVGVCVGHTNTLYSRLMANIP